MKKAKRAWLKVEQFVIVNKHAFWLAAFVFFFFVFPLLVTDSVDWDAISSTIP